MGTVYFVAVIVTAIAAAIINFIVINPARNPKNYRRMIIADIVILVLQLLFMIYISVSFLSLTN